MISFDDLSTALKDALDQDEDGQVTSNDILLRLFDMNDDGVIDHRDRMLLKLRQQLKSLDKKLTMRQLERLFIYIAMTLLNLQVKLLSEVLHLSYNLRWRTS
jgi:Ca2+-binding EF-hand superfamily protein